MQKMIRGTAAFLILFGLGACYDYPSGTINNGNFHIVQGTPAVGWIGKVGDSLQVQFRFINDANNGTITSYDSTSTFPAAALALHYQQHFRQVFCGDTLCDQPDKNLQSYYVVGLQAGEWTVKMVPRVNPADTGSVLIRVAPTNLGLLANLAGPLTNSTTTFGDSLVFTAPQYAKFSPSASAVSWVANGTSTPVATMNRSADSTRIAIVTTHGMNGFFTITNVQVRLPTLASGVSVTARSVDSLKPVP